jgi:adenylate kinase
MSQKVLKTIRILLLGAPGSGKGTQTSRLLKDFTQISAISSGDLLRQNIKDKTPLGTYQHTHILATLHPSFTFQKKKKKPA